MARQLVVMRHAKAAHAPGLADKERPLDPHGRGEAAAAGEWIAEHVGAVDQVLCSTAVRTRETLRYTGVDAPAEFSSDIYGGWTDDLLDQVRLVDDSADTVLLIGHSPVVGQLVLSLAGEQNDVTRSVRQRFPTAGVAVMNCHATWADLGPGGATATGFFIPG